MSSGKKTATTTSTNDPPAWATPYFKGNLDAASKYSQQPYTPYTGQRVAGQNQMNPYTSNQYADQRVQQLGTDITNNYQNGIAPNQMAQFQMGGAFGGSAHMQAMQGSQAAFARELANGSNDIRSQNADAQRGEYNNMLGRNQAGLDANYQQYQDQQNYGAKRIGLMNDALGSIRGNTTSSTGANPNYTSAAQNVGSYAAILASMYGNSNGGGWGGV